MPRHVINLAPEEYQFNDQPLLHEGIWKAASTIAQAPLQMAQLRMQQEDRDLERQNRLLQMQNVQSEIGARSAAATRQGEQDKYRKEQDIIKHRETATTQGRLAARDAASAAKNTSGAKTAEAQRKELLAAGLNPTDYTGQPSSEVDSALYNAKQVKSQGLGKSSITPEQALVHVPKKDAEGHELPYNTVKANADDYIQAHYKPTLGQKLGQQDTGSPMSLQMATTPDAPDYGAQPGAAPQPAADTNQPSGSPAHTLHARLKTLAPEAQMSVINNMKMTNPALLEQILRLHAAERGVSAPSVSAPTVQPSMAMPTMRMAEPY